MALSCPVTSAYLHAVHNLFDLSLVHNEMWAEPFDELKKRAALAGGERIRQHQRAFLCIELMLNFLLGSENAPKSWPRSREGLNLILGFADEQRNDLIAEVTEFYYLQRRPIGIEQIQQDQYRKQAELYKLICESCVILRQALKNQTVSLMRVGTRLALASNIAGYYIPDMFTMAGNLLEHNEEVALRAWELPTM